MADNYVKISDYLEALTGGVLVFVLKNFRGEEIHRQIVPKDQLKTTLTESVKTKFLVDSALSSRMVPGQYTLFLYIAIPKTGLPTSPSYVIKPTDYSLFKCLTEQGIGIQVRGGLNNNTIGG
jgi:hypothetical protein